MIVKLAAVNKNDVFKDIVALVPNWNDKVTSPINGKHIIQLQDRVLELPVYDDYGNEISSEVLAGETRYDIVIPDNQIIPNNLNTRVFPNISDHKLY